MNGRSFLDNVLTCVLCLVQQAKQQRRRDEEMDSRIVLKIKNN